MKSYLLVCLVMLLAVVGCKSEKSATARGVSEDFTLYMKRTACMGRCPVYEVHVDAQGKVMYHGYLNVEHIGRFEKDLSPATLRKLVQAVNEAGYFEMDERYDLGIADLPGVMMNVTLNGQSREVDMRSGGPDALRTLHDQVDELIGEGGYSEVAKK